MVKSFEAAPWQPTNLLETFDFVSQIIPTSTVIGNYLLIDMWSIISRTL